MLYILRRKKEPIRKIILKELAVRRPRGRPKQGDGISVRHGTTRVQITGEDVQDQVMWRYCTAEVKYQLR